MRIVFVTPRLGSAVVGGAERQALEFAQRLTAGGHDVKVLTTCAASHATWKNELPAGQSNAGGVRVERYPVTRPVDPLIVAQVGALLEAGLSIPLAQQREWLLSTGFSEPLLDAVAAAGAGGATLIFTPYLFSTTVHGAAITPERSIIIPCLHDEPYAEFQPVQETLRSAAGLIFNTDAERNLAARLLGSLPSHRTVGFGFDPPGTRDPDGFRHRHSLSGDYVVYAGRTESGKAFPEVVEYVAAYDLLLEPDNPISLVVIGGGHVSASPRMSRFVHDAGFLDAGGKFDALAGCTALINLSRSESFSHVLAEAWLVGSPAIVHSECPVTREHCEVSGGGLWVDSVESFAEALTRLRGDRDLRSALGDAGRRYVRDRYSWAAVMPRLTEAIESLARAEPALAAVVA